MTVYFHSIDDDDDEQFEHEVSDIEKEYEHVAYMHIKQPPSITPKRKAQAKASAQVEVPLPLGFASNRCDPVPMHLSGPDMEFSPPSPDQSFAIVEEDEDAQKKFQTGTFKNKTFHDVLHDHPSYYVKVYKQKSLPKEISEFVQWVDKYYDVNKETMEITARTRVQLTPRGHVAASAHGAAGSSSSGIPRPCPGGCDNFHRKGSSARYIRTTCLRCGNVTQEERYQVTKDPATCKHENVDHRGSNRHVRKTYCKDCGTTIDIVDQDLHKQMQQIKQKFAEADLEDTTLLQRVMGETVLDNLTVIAASELMLTSVRRMQAGDYNLKDIISMFVDCIDRSVLEERAFVCIKEKTTLQPQSPFHQETQTTKLRVVDPIEDEGVWVIVDDACNSCCHGEMWRLNADKKFNDLGFRTVKINEKITKFKGLGDKTTTGKYRFPMALKLLQSELILPGAVASHEVEGAWHPLLLSQNCQA